MIRTAANCRDMMSAWSWPRRGHHSLLDIGGWILLGSCLALVAILAAATYHYRQEPINIIILASVHMFVRPP